MIFLFPYRLTYDFSILAKNYHTKSTGATICCIGYPTKRWCKLYLPLIQQRLVKIRHITSNISVPKLLLLFNFVVVAFLLLFLLIFLILSFILLRLSPLPLFCSSSTLPPAVAALLHLLLMLPLLVPTCLLVNYFIIICLRLFPSSCFLSFPSFFSFFSSSSSTSFSSCTSRYLYSFSLTPSCSSFHI